MGFVANTANRVREFFRQDKEALALRMAKGTTSAGYPGSGYDLLQAYGYDVLSDYLKLEHDLLARFVDYEEMDDYPELSTALDIYADDACITRDTEIPLLDGTVETVGSLFDRKAKGEWIYAYDAVQGRVVAGQFERVTQIAASAPVFKVTFVDKNGLVGSIKATADHKFLMANGEYREVKNIKPNDRLMALFKFKFRNKKRKQDYENVLVAPFKREWQSTHRMVLESTGTSLLPGYVVHHKDHNGLNNTPGNLEQMPLAQHITEHRKLGADNPKFRGDITVSDLLLALRGGYLPRNVVASKLGCGYRVVDRLALEAGFKSWSDLKLKLYGLESHSRGHAPGSLYVEKANRILEGMTSLLAENSSISFVGACAQLHITRSEGEEAVRRMGFGSWCEFKVAKGGVLRPSRWAKNVVHNDIVISVEPCGEEAVFDLVNSIPTHNFAAGLGGRYVFVKNSQPETQLNRSIWVESKDESVQGLLDDLLHKTLRMDEEVWEIARTMCKYGNDYEEILVTEKGVEGLNFLPAPTVRRIEGPRGELFGFVQDFRGKFGYSPQEFQQILAARAASKMGGDSKVGMGGLDRIAALEDWEVAHFRLRGKQRRSIYGYSVMESARWIWKRLMLLEDAALIYRLQRAPERYAFYVDVGDLPPAEALAFVNRVRQQHKKTKYFNPTCLTADTCITCLDGVDRSIGELARDYADKQFGVFSYDLKAGRVVPGVASAPRKTGEQAAIWRVVLDNGAVVRCTANHPFLMRDGTYKAASELTAYDSLMPLYMSRGSKGTQDYWMYEEPSTSKRTFVHKMVAESVYGADALKGMHVHHRNENKSDNTPDNLEPLTASDHLKRHPENALKGRLAFVARMTTDSDFSKTVVKRLEDWRVREPEAAKASAMRSGTVSMALRKEQAKTGQARVLEFMESEVVRDPLVVVDDLVERLNSNPEFVEVYGQLPTTAHEHITTGCLHAFVRRQGFKGFKDFKIKKCGEAKWKNRTYGGEPTAAKQISNHKVVSSTFVGYEDVYNLDVADYHNFALTAGVFVHNSGKLDLKFNPISQDEDFFVPSRKGQDGTRIEVLGAPSWQHMEDIEYFRDKLFAAIKVPKAYMGQEAGIARQVLSSEDVRFARTVLRVQREMRNGLSKICRVHMMALNINPYNTDYDIRMTVPSSIFELAQLEVRNARADLAARMQSFVPMKFLMSNVFGFNDYDIEKIIKGQEEDTIRMGIVQVKAQIAAQKYQEEHAPAPQPGAEGAPGALPDVPQNPNVPVDPNVNVAAPNNPPMPPPAQGAQPPQQQQQRFNPVRFGNSLNEKRLLARGGLGFTEREMCEGSSSRKDKENYHKLEQLLKNDKQTAVRLMELRALVDDIRGSQRR